MSSTVRRPRRLVQAEQPLDLGGLERTRLQVENGVRARVLHRAGHAARIMPGTWAAERRHVDIWRSLYGPSSPLQCPETYHTRSLRDLREVDTVGDRYGAAPRAWGEEEMGDELLALLNWCTWNPLN